MFEKFPPANFIPTESTVEGIDIFMPRPEQTAQQPVVEFGCPQCGGQTAYSAADGGLTCTNCGYYEPPQQVVVGKGATEFEFTVTTMERAARGWGTERKQLQCQSCGAYTAVPPDTITHSCPFCQSNRVIQHQALQDVLRPRFVIPFKLEEQDCRTIAQTWMGNSWMVPKGLRQAIVTRPFSGVYLPFWTFDSTLNARWRAEVGHQETEQTYSNGEWTTTTKTVWKWESGQERQTVDDMLIWGTTHVSSLLLGQVIDFQLSDLAPYEAQYLAGFQAQNYDISLEQSWETARQKMREQIKKACRQAPSTSRVRNFSMELDFDDETWRYILLPVYLSSYRYRDKVYQVLINAQTGTISGQRPADWPKIWLVIALAMSPAIIAALIGLIQRFFYGYLRSGWLPCSFGLFLVGLIVAIILIVIATGLDDA